MTPQTELTELRLAYELMKFAHKEEHALRLYAERRITEWQERCAKLTIELDQLKGVAAK